MGSALLDFLLHNWAIVAIVSTIATLIVVPRLVLLKYVRISLNIMRTTKPPLSRTPLDFNRLTGQRVRFFAFDGFPLAGAIVRASDDAPRRGLIVFAHEYCSDKDSCARYCKPLLDAGYDVFTFDFRGHGESDPDEGYHPRQWVSDREIDDMRGAVQYACRWLEEQGLPPEVGVVGVSRGASAALVTAAETPAIKCLVSDGAFSTDSMIEHFMKRWAYIFAYSSHNYDAYPPLFWRVLRCWMMARARREFGCTFPSVRKAIQHMTPRPILFIHGEKDSYLPVEQSRRLYALAAQPKYLWIAPGARHNQAALQHPADYAHLTRAFFDRYLSGHRTADLHGILEHPTTPAAGARPAEDERIAAEA